MDLTPEHVYWTGFGILIIYIMIVYFKMSRRKYVMISLFIIGIISSIIGLLMFEKPEYEMEKGNVATAFFSPIIYISTYQLLRIIFKKMKGIEPAYEFAATYDFTDKRKLNFLDYIVFVVPMGLSFVSSLLIGWK